MSHWGVIPLTQYKLLLTHMLRDYQIPHLSLQAKFNTKEGWLAAIRWMTIAGQVAVGLASGSANKCLPRTNVLASEATSVAIWAAAKVWLTVS